MGRGSWGFGRAWKRQGELWVATDLAAKHPEKLRELQDLWWVEAARYRVLPLDRRGTDWFNAEAMGRPSLIRGRKSMAYYPGTIGVPDAASPPMLNKSWTITADLDISDDKTSGMIVTHGGLEGGYGLYLQGGVPTFVYNFLGTEWMTFTAKDPIPKGKTQLAVEFKYDGGGVGKGGAITISANGKSIAEGRMEKTIPNQFSLGEGLDIGMDVGSAVDLSYKLPFAFTGTIERSPSS